MQIIHPTEDLLNQKLWGYGQQSVVFLFLFFWFFFGGGGGGEEQRKSKRENLKQGPGPGAHRAWTHHSENMTWAEIKNQMVNRPSYPGAQAAICVLISCLRDSNTSLSSEMSTYEVTWITTEQNGKSTSNNTTWHKIKIVSTFQFYKKLCFG